MRELFNMIPEAPTLPGLRIGRLELDVPVVLAPMAGVTNMAFRRLCREYGAGLYVSEMVTSRALVERTPGSLRLIRHHESETPRSIQLYGVDPRTVSEAVKFLVDEDLCDHIDVNFGCPVPKITRRGGGSALPWKSDLFRAIVVAAVSASGDIPLTVKMRKGIDEDHLSYLDAGRAAEDAGVQAITLHGRTANEFYSGSADWDAIAQLKQVVTSVPVLGNGDIWSAGDAINMVRQTGCDGVVVGRGCLGRPWLFGDLSAAFRAYRGEISGVEAQDALARPPLGVVMNALRRHTELLVEFFDGDQGHACRDIRKHVAWYFTGYGVGSEVRRQLAAVDSLERMDEIFLTLDADMPYPGSAAEGRRGRAGSPKRVHLPEGWLDSRTSSVSDRARVSEGERVEGGSDGG